MKCIHCGRLLSHTEVAVCGHCRSKGEIHSQAASHIPGLRYGDIGTALPPATNPLGPILAGIFFGAVILVVCLSDAFYFAAFGTAARTGTEQSGAWLDLTLGRKFFFSGVVFDVGKSSPKLEAAGVGRPLILISASDFAKVRKDYPSMEGSPQKATLGYTRTITPLSNEPALKGDLALALKGRKVSIAGFYARVDNGRSGTDTLEFTGGDTKLIYVSSIVLK